MADNNKDKKPAQKKKPTTSEPDEEKKPAAKETTPDSGDQNQVAKRAKPNNTLVENMFKMFGMRQMHDGMSHGRHFSQQAEQRECMHKAENTLSWCDNSLQFLHHEAKEFSAQIMQGDIHMNPMISPFWKTHHCVHWHTKGKVIDHAGLHTLSKAEQTLIDELDCVRTHK